MAFAIVDVAKQLSNDTFVGKMTPGVVSKLTNTIPDVQIGDTEFFDLSARTKGEIVGEAAAKSPTPTDAPLRHIRTTKIQYTERLSEEFLLYDEAKQLGIVEKLARKWMESDFLRDLDTVVIHGINPLSGTTATSVADYIAKAGSSILVPTTGTTGAAINADLKDALAALDGADVNGIAFSNKAAAALAGLTTTAGTPEYPSLGKFGLNVETFEGIRAAASKELGDYNDAQLIVGDWNALRWGIAAEMPVELIRYGDPDGQGDLKRYNQVALRYEVIFGFGIANPNALAIVAASESES